MSCFELGSSSSHGVSLSEVTIKHSNSKSNQSGAKQKCLDTKAFSSFSVTAVSMIIYLAMAKMSNLSFFPLFKRLFRVDLLLSGFIRRNSGYDLSEELKVINRIFMCGLFD